MRRWNLFFVVVLALLFCAGSASATTFTGMMNDIIRGTPGVTNITIAGGGVRASVSGAVDVAAGAYTIPVATSVTADIGAAALARGAARVAVRAIPWVGTALVVKDVADAINNSGITTCPPPAFFCKAGSAVPTNGVSITKYLVQNSSGSITSGYVDSSQAACAGYVAERSKVPQSDGTFSPYTVVSVTDTSCNYKSEPTPSYPNTTNFTLPVSKQLTCNGVVVTTETCVVPATPGAGDPVGGDDPDFNKTLSDKMNADHNWAMKMKAQMDTVSQANPGMAPPVDVSNVPVTVSAPSQVAGPSTVVSTKVLPNADGSTSTETVSQQTVVTPQVTPGGTVSNPGVTFPSTTTSTTTTVNNTTNVSNVTTTTTNNPAPPAEKVDLPTDYNREATQKAMLQQLDGTYIGAVPVDQEARQKTELAKTDAGLAEKFTAIPTQFDSDKSSWFSWVWTPPIATCSNSMWSGSVHGFAVAFDLCPWVDKIRDAVGFLFALFGAINIYGNLFRSRDNV